MTIDDSYYIGNILYWLYYILLLLYQTWLRININPGKMNPKLQTAV